jgi:transglutaminase/protease-like cytokinesis protein 3
MMCDDVGLDCYIVIGEVIGGGGHAWNLVKIDGQWYHLDTTWNDGCGDRSQYFLIPDSYFDGYRIWNRDMYPPVATAPYLR